jgi:hypothetical protein
LTSLIGFARVLAVRASWRFVKQFGESFVIKGGILAKAKKTPDFEVVHRSPGEWTTEVGIPGHRPAYHLVATSDRSRAWLRNIVEKVTYEKMLRTVGSYPPIQVSYVEGKLAICADESISLPAIMEYFQRDCTRRLVELIEMGKIQG